MRAMIPMTAPQAAANEEEWVEAASAGTEIEVGTEVEN